jgi:hypothetical protein
MTCREFIDNVHDLLDSRLQGREASSLVAHMEGCSRCRRIYAQYVQLQHLVSERAHLPGASSRLILRRLQRRTWRGFLGSVLDRAWTWARDFDRRLLYLRATTAPFALGFFLFLLVQFAPADTERLAYMAIEPQLARHNLPRVLNVEVRQNQPEFDAMLTAAWRLPYEDSLSLIAEVQPEGRLKVEGVLEYPKSDALLNAAHAALNTSYLEQSGNLSNSLLIFSFQKIDVYENN